MVGMMGRNDSPPHPRVNFPYMEDLRGNRRFGVDLMPDVEL